MDANRSRSINHKLPKFIAPGMLCNWRGKRQYAYHPSNENIKIGTPQLLVGEQQSQSAINYSRNSGISAHILIMHFGEVEFEEKDFNEDSSFLDILNICKNFIDIYSIGIKVTDGDGRPLRNDQDVLAMLKEHEDLIYIDVYLEKDERAKPLSFKMPQDNPTLAPCIPSNPKVTNVKILGDLKADNKVNVCGTVIGGSEQASMVQLFITISKSFDVEYNLQAISQSKTKKEFRLPLEAVGHYVVAKYTPMNQDGKCGESVFVISDKMVENSSPQKKRKVRGENKNKKIAGLKSGEKLDVIFYNNRPMGKNHQYWSRHLGKIVRDRNICPVQVQKWKDIGNLEKQHMWEAVKECFDNPTIELYRDNTLEHMGSLWTSWRSLLNVKYVKPCKTRTEALKNVPPGMNVKDWEWLVTNKFLTEGFQKISEQNCKNRSASVMGMPHRTGSKPHREIIYEKGGKDSQTPDLEIIFLETRSKNEKLNGKEEINKYDEIVKTIQSEPSLTNLEVVEKCFGPQRHGHVFGYGGGVKRKTFNDSKSAYIKELEAKLNDKEEENRDLKRRMEGIESRLDRIENGFTESPSVGTTIGTDIQQDES